MTRTILLALSLALTALSAGAQDTAHFMIEALAGRDTLVAGYPTTIYFGFDNRSDDTIKVVSTAFRIYSPNGAHFDSLTALGCDYSCPNFDRATATVFLDHDGIGNDVVWYGGVADVGGLMPHGQYAPMGLRFKTRAEDIGKSICIDSAMVAPVGKWTWSWLRRDGSRVTPEWGGPYCYTIGNPPHPYFWRCPEAIYTQFNQDIQYQFGASVFDTQKRRFCVLSGPGTIDSMNGFWQSGPLSGGRYPLIVCVTDGHSSDTCATQVVVSPYSFFVICPSAQAAAIGRTSEVTLHVQPEEDQVIYSLVSVGGATGVVTLERNLGHVQYTPSEADALLPQPIVMRFTATDGFMTSGCSLLWYVQGPGKYRVEIGYVPDQLQGQYATLPITLTKADTIEGLGGFDLLLAYDNSALSFQKAFSGSIYDSCGWEYFTYRFGANGNCSSGCPSGMIRIVGVADTNVGDHRPGCQPSQVGQLPVTLANLKFLVTNDRTYECQFVPLRFFWTDCTDNTFSNVIGTKLFISSKVQDYGNDTPIDNGSIGFPTYLGAQDDCETMTLKAEVVRSVAYQNGGIRIACADSIEVCPESCAPFSDLGRNYAAQAYLMMRHFIYGESHTGTNGECTCAWDIDGDGTAETLIDFQMLVRTFLSASGACHTTSEPHPGTYSYSAGILSVSADSGVGAVWVTVEGEITPVLLAANMTMSYASDSGKTRILVSDYMVNYDWIESFNGAVLDLGGAGILQLEAVNPCGERLLLDPTYASESEFNLPTSFSLSQNYPNPFNPVTSICFDLPTAGTVSLQVLNLQGQIVQTLAAGQKSAGRYTVSWDGKNFNGENVASGIYFYRLTANDFIQTRKMLLIK